MRKFWMIICIVIALVIIDQGAKLAMDRFYEPDTDEALIQVKDTFHIHPIVNYKTPNELAERAEKTGLSVTFWQIADIFKVLIESTVVVLFIWCFYKITVLAGRKRYSRLVNTLVILFCASVVCGICDRIFWDGTHDFLCISISHITDIGRTKIVHKSADIKDCYLAVHMVLFFVYLFLFAFNIYKLSKDKEAFSAFKKSFKEKMKKLFCISNKRKKEEPR